MPSRPESSRSETDSFCLGCGILTESFCPTCVKLHLPKSSSAFCSKPCFTKCWKQHKKIHKKEILAITNNESSNDDNGVNLVEREGLGRALVASRSFAVGEVVIMEEPLIIYDDIPDLLVQFVLTMSAEDKVKIMNMHHLTENSDVLAPFRPVLKYIVAESQKFAKMPSNPHLTLMKSAEVVCISIMNAHRFRGVSANTGSI